MAIDPSFSEELAPKQPKHSGAMSEEEFHELEDRCPDYRYEYVAGRAHKMGGATVGHSRISRNIASTLDTHLSGSCTAFGSDVQVLLGVKKNGKKHYVYPDTTVSCTASDSRSDILLVETPKVVIEVLSPSTEPADRGVKFRAYQNCATIQEIVLVNQYIRHIEIWQRDEHDTDKWNCRHYGQGETVEFASIHVRVDIGELYQGVHFAVYDENE